MKFIDLINEDKHQLTPEVNKKEQKLLKRAKMILDFYSEGEFPLPGSDAILKYKILKFPEPTIIRNDEHSYVVNFTFHTNDMFLGELDLVAVSEEHGTYSPNRSDNINVDDVVAYQRYGGYLIQHLAYLLENKNIELKYY